VLLFVATGAAIVGTAALVGWPALLGLAGLALAAGPIGVVRSGAVGPALIPVLAGTSQVQMAVALTFGTGILLA